MHAWLWPVAGLICAVQLSGCGTPPRRSSGAETERSAPRHPPLKGGGYYQDDGPGETPPDDLLTRPDPIPRIEPLASGANKPYSVFGRQYVPLPADAVVRQRGIASWYGRKFHGQRTSTGESYDMYAMSAAHPTMPLPSYARVSNPANGRSVMVRVNDRGPFLRDRIIDLSYAAAYKLGLVGSGSGEVVVERLTPTQIAQLQAASAGATMQINQIASAEPVPPKTAAGAMAPASAAPMGRSVSPVSAPAPALASSARSSASRSGTENTASADTVDTGAVALPVDLIATPAPESNGYAAPEAPNDLNADSSIGVLPAVNTVNAPPALSGSQVYVQIGAFGTRSNAERLQSRVEQGFERLAAPLRIVDDERLFKLQAGPLDAAQAQQLSAQLRQRFALTPMLIAR